MLALFNIVLPVFIVIGAGYSAVRGGLLSREHADGLMKFATSFAVPCLLFSAISRLDLGASFDPRLLASFYIGATTSFILTALTARHLLKHNSDEAVVIGFAALFGNTLLLGLAIVERAYGAATMQLAFVIISIHAPFCYLLGIITMEFVRASDKPIGVTLLATLKTVLTNALMIAIMLGFFVNLTGLPLPGTFWAAIEMVSRAALPVALFGLGGALAQYGLRGNLRDVTVVSVSKLLIHPGITWLLATQVFDLPTDFTRAAVMIAAMAPGANVYIFASMYNRAQKTIATSVITTTALSILSASAWLAFLGT